MKKVVRDILIGLDDKEQPSKLQGLDEKQLMDKLNEFTEKKRYEYNQPNAGDILHRYF